ncbi:MAG: hypothetical protein WA761_08860 [Thermoplasmata archaeon]
MQKCPFCGGRETERLTIEGQRFLIFECMFTPQVDARWSEAELADHLTADYGQDGRAYFRGMCDRLHLYVVKGEGARRLLDPEHRPSAP